MKEIDENQFRNKITALSFCTIIFVISAHTYNVSVYGLRERVDLFSCLVVWLEDWVRRFEGDFCIGFMFVISGYLFYSSFTWKKLLAKYQSRFRTVVVPYLFWSSFYFVYYCIITRLPMLSSMINGGEPVEFSVFNWIKWLTVDQYYVLWFLKDLIIMIICAPVIYVFLKNRFRIPTGLLILIICFLIEFEIIKVPLTLFNVHYLVGAYIGINHKQIPRLESKVVCYIARIVLAAMLLWELVCVMRGMDYNQLVPVLLYVSVWFSFNGVLFNKKLKWWWGISFFIYCIHDFYLEAFEKLFYILFGNHSLWAFIDYVCMPFVVAAVSVFTAAILKQVCPRLWGLITGSRG